MKTHFFVIAFFALFVFAPAAFAAGSPNGSACSSSSECSGGFCNSDTSNPNSMYGVCASSAAKTQTTGVDTSKTQTTGVDTTGQNVTLINPLGAGTNIETLINQILAFVVRIGAIIVILMLVYVGFLFVTAKGNESKIIEARQALLWTIIGALILLGAQVISLGIQATVQALSTGNASTNSTIPSAGSLTFPGASSFSGGTVTTATQQTYANAINQAQNAFNTACSQYGNTSNECKSAGATLQQVVQNLSNASGGTLGGALGTVTSAIKSVTSGTGSLNTINSAVGSLTSKAKALFGGSGSEFDDPKNGVDYAAPPDTSSYDNNTDYTAPDTSAYDNSTDYTAPDTSGDNQSSYEAPTDTTDTSNDYYY
ncbi:MAG: pilin [Candidatus Kaiserbacteria bacterium]|nr:pilin [Candidatus Kaiserbacteria bacterium]